MASDCVGARLIPLFYTQRVWHIFLEGVSMSVQVTVRSQSGLQQEIVSRRHHFTSDEPLPFGTDGGPSPYELLLASLGACTSMTLRMYAERKGIDLGQVTIRLQHFRIHAEDCANCETKVGFLDRIEREIEFTGQLQEAQKTHLLEIADRCPVHRTLKSEIDIRTSLATAEGQRG
jgi:putative redox protein